MHADSAGVQSSTDLTVTPTGCTPLDAKGRPL